MAKEIQTVFHGENIVGTMEGDILCLRIDTSKRLRPSRATVNKDGTLNPPKSTIIGTSGGNKPVMLPNGTQFRLGVTAYLPNAKDTVVTE